MLVTSLSLAWLAGIFGGSVLPLPTLAVLILGISSGILAFSLRSHRWLVLGCLVVVAATLGMLRYRDNYDRLAQDPLGDLRDQGRVSMRGIVAQEPVVGDVTARWTFEVRSIRVERGEDWQPRAGLVQVYSRFVPPVRYGDELEVQGKLETVPRLGNFDYQEYLARQGVHAVVRYPSIHVLSTGNGNKGVELIHALRQRLADSVQAALPEPQGALALGILLGMQNAIPQQIRDEFKRTATTHILAISGHNLSVVAGLLAGGGAWLVGRRHWAYLLGLLLTLWSYAVLTGPAPSVVRAAIMASMVLLAGFAGRQSFAPLALTFSAALMSLVDPTLLWDVGFQLSFGAMAGIVFAAPLLERMAERLLAHRIRWPASLDWLATFLRAETIATLGATLTTIPIQAMDFQSIPLTALPTTLLALPALPGIMLGSFATAVVGLLVPGLAAIPAAVTWVFTSYMLQIVHWWSLVPGASLQLPVIEPQWAWLYGGVLVALLWVGFRWARTLPPPRDAPPSAHGTSFLKGNTLPGWVGLRVLLALVIIANLGVLTLLFTAPDNALRVRFLDVGQGDAILLETHTGQRILVDGGPSPTLLLNRLGNYLPFWDRGIDLVILTHPQRDHLVGLLGVIQRYQVGAVLENSLRGTTADYGEWERLLQERGVKRIDATAGTKLNLTDAQVEVLYPTPQALRVFSQNSNDASLVIKVSAYGKSLLLAGDIERNAENLLLSYGADLSSNVLKLPHHGSKTSSSQGFLDAVAPQMAVVSVGRSNPFGHPDAEVLDRLHDLPVLRTDQDGTIELTFSSKAGRIQGERSRDPQ